MTECHFQAQQCLCEDYRKRTSRERSILFKLPGVLSKAFVRHPLADLQHGRAAPRKKVWF